MTPSEIELLEGMGNCYSVCGEDFENTVRMVAGARGLEAEDVRKILERLRRTFQGDEEYRKLRRRLPEDFPM